MSRPTKAQLVAKVKKLETELNEQERKTEDAMHWLEERERQLKAMTERAKKAERKATEIHQNNLRYRARCEEHREAERQLKTKIAKLEGK